VFYLRTNRRRFRRVRRRSAQLAVRQHKFPDGHQRIERKKRTAPNGYRNVPHQAQSRSPNGLASGLRQTQMMSGSAGTVSRGEALAAAATACN